MYPEELMTNVYWGFYGNKFNSLEKFTQEVISYNNECENEWIPTEIVLDCPVVTIQYSHWKNEEEIVEDYVDLAADNQSNFTAGELLYKIHNQVVDVLKEENHQFFEGLTLLKEEKGKKTNPPTYFINQKAIELFC